MAIYQKQMIREVVREWMHGEMRSISEETIFAGWECGLEFRLWRAVQALPRHHEYYGTTIPAARIERLYGVAQWLDEWAMWTDSDGVIAVSLEQWKVEFAKASQP
jgi:hypothetical protein